MNISIFAQNKYYNLRCIFSVISNSTMKHVSWTISYTMKSITHFFHFVFENKKIQNMILPYIFAYYLIGHFILWRAHNRCIEPQWFACTHSHTTHFESGISLYIWQCIYMIKFTWEIANKSASDAICAVI